MSEHMPPEDDPIIRSLRAAGLRPLPPSPRNGRSGGGRRSVSRAAVVFGIVLLILLLVVPTAASRLSDWLWYREIGFERVFFTKIVAQWTLGAIVGVAAFVFLYGNARIALRGSEQERAALIERLGGRMTLSTASIERGFGWVVFAATALLSLLAALAAAAQWRTALQLFYRAPFGIADPIFGRDIGYYVFVLPALELASDVVFLVLVLALLIAVPIRLIRGDFTRVGLRWRNVTRSSPQTQLAVLVALFFFATALRIELLGVPSLLFGQHLPLSGASYVDLHARLPALHVLAIAAVLAGALVLWGSRRGRLVPVAARTLIGYVLISIVAALVPAAYQRLVVQANELARETPQIAHHIRATRQAWGIDDVQQRELGDETRLTPRLIASNRPTVDNVRLWDREPLLQTFGQIQSIRTYYDFVAVDDDRYQIDGQLRQVMLSAREMNTDALPTRGFINEHLTYTHGMGVTLGPSNEVTAEGLPVLFIKDLPPVSSVNVRVTRPQIYYGEIANDFVLAPSRQREFDYPAGEGDAAAYSSYDGHGGVRVASFARRLLYAVRFGSLNILLSRDLTDSTRILYHRGIRERAQRSLPFLLFDRDPYLVITSDGRLQWIVDGYTTSSRFPYAEPISGGINYMRNSVKVVIDAYNGDVRAYLTDPSDPIIRTLSRIYPGLLQPLDSMPADLRAHIRYPEDLFRLQTALYATYHMNNPETFYHREDQWQIPSLSSAPSGSGAERGASEAFLRHMVMRLPGEAQPEFILMRPFTPRQKDNLAAWMVARNDGAHYGKLAVFSFPRQSLVFGPNQIVNRINQDTEVSRQITLWDQRGSEVLRGELLVLPVEGALIYVQPLYLRAQGGRIPELKRVIVAHEGRVFMAETLDAALAGLFGTGIGTATPPLASADSAAAPVAGAAPSRAPANESAAQALARRALEHYDRARAAQRAEDWAAYGAEMRLLGEVLRQMGASDAAAYPPRGPKR